MDHFWKSSLNLLQHCFCFMFGVFWPQGRMWDLSSLTTPPALPEEVLSTGPPGKSPPIFLEPVQRTRFLSLLGIQNSSSPPRPHLFISFWLCPELPSRGNIINSLPGTFSASSWDTLSLVLCSNISEDLAPFAPNFSLLSVFLPSKSSQPGKALSINNILPPDAGWFFTDVCQF